MKRRNVCAVCFMLLSALSMWLCTACGAFVKSSTPLVTEAEPFHTAVREKLSLVCWGDAVYYVTPQGDLLYFDGRGSRTERLASGVKSVADPVQMRDMLDDNAEENYVDVLYLTEAGEVFSSHSGKVLFSGAVQLATGTSHVLVLDEDGGVWAWGNNYALPCGTDDEHWNPDRWFAEGAEQSYYIPQKEPRKVLEHAVKVDAYSAVSAALLADGRLMTWGDNSLGLIGNGQRGNGFPTITTTVQSTPFCVMRNVVDFTFDHSHMGAVYAFRQDGSVWGWGDFFSRNDAQTAMSPQPIGEGFVDLFGYRVMLREDGELVNFYHPEQVLAQEVSNATVVFYDYDDRQIGSYAIVLHTDGMLETILIEREEDGM